MVWKILITACILGGVNGLLAILLVIAESLFANYGECVIDINGKKKLTVPGGSALLTTLNREKIFLPSACGGRGTCAFCKCQVIEGAGPILPTESVLLTEQERNDRIRLSCQIKVKNDLIIRIPEALFNIKEFNASVERIEPLTHDIHLVKLRLIDPAEIDFIPGQYVQLYNNPYDGVKEVVSRAYSIASSSRYTGSIDLIIRLIPEGMVTTWVHTSLQVGESVRFTGPMGDFRYHEGEGEIVMVAGGSGMAPMVPLLDQLAEQACKRRITYFFGAVSRRDLFYLDEMKAFETSLPDFTFVPALSQPADEDRWKGATGLITKPLESHLKRIETSNAQAYLCGSPGMIKACLEVFKQYGVTPDRTYFDPFA